MIKTDRDGFPRLSALSVRRGDAGHRKACATTSESLDDATHRQRHPFYPTDRMDDPYGSLSSLLGISTRIVKNGQYARKWGSKMKLPVFAVVRDAYVFVWRERKRFWSLALPGVGIVAISGGVNFLELVVCQRQGRFLRGVS
jgi:hypothetical protein